MVKFSIEFIRVCPYCRKQAKIKTATCGRWKCQWTHHIVLMRKRRKTDQTRPSRRII